MSPLRTLLLALPLAALPLLSACGGEKAAACADNVDCEDGQACIDEECQDVTCLTSADCEIQQYCDADFECSAGCSIDDDCLAGQSCNTDTNQCQAYGCRNTQLDCNYGEQCDVTTGQCYVADEGLCTATCDIFSPNCGGDSECVAMEYVGDCDAGDGDRGCPANSPCAIVEVDESDTCDWFGFPDDSACPSGWACDYLETSSGRLGYYCHDDQCIESQCFPSCDSTADCPRGFDCLDLGDGSKACFADCTWLTDNGHL